MIMIVGPVLPEIPQCGTFPHGDVVMHVAIDLLSNSLAGLGLGGLRRSFLGD
jgi:hypothetical protein